MRVAYLGPPGTFSHEALLAAGVDGLEEAPSPSIPHAIAAVRDGQADAALVPVENALEGSVDTTLDALVLAGPEIVIAGELVHGVRSVLAGRDGTRPAAVRTVVSHPQASGQCARWLRERLPDAAVVAAGSTADAMRMVAQDAVPGERPAAALGPRASALRHGLAVLAEDLEDAESATRFFWVTAPGRAVPGAAEPIAGAGSGDDAPGAWRTVVVFWGAGTGAPGWLVRCLAEFASRGVNLTRIESRPRREAGFGAYLFWVELAGAADQEAVAGAVAGLRMQAEAVRILGSFAAAPG